MMPLTTVSKLPDWIMMCLLSIITFFSPVLVQMYFLFFLILVDLITGIWAAKKQNKKITIKKLLLTVNKTISYILLVCIGYIFDTVFIKEAFGAPYMINIFIMLLALNEFRSSVMNISKVLGYDIWNLVLNSLGKKKLEDVIKEKDE